MTNFSNALKITDVNDFIAPSQACVVRETKSLSHGGEAGQVQIQERSHKKLSDDPVKISLHDCLACSGCVTTAEAILLESQSVDEFDKKLADPNSIVVVSLSLQSVASLAVEFRIEPLRFLKKLCYLLKEKGARAVFDVHVAMDIALLENAGQLQERVQRNEALPMLASSCPGWICYAEKSQGDLLPLISRVKSPQAIMGTLLKRFWIRGLGDVMPSDVYHVAVMPCFDKKLEAVRDDFSVGSESSCPETDMVLATSELYEWITRHSISPASVCGEASLDVLFHDVEKAKSQDSLMGNYDFLDLIDSNSASVGSDGYLDFIYRYVAHVSGIQIPRAAPIAMTPGRNPDYKECTLETDQRHFAFASVYGFRNIQGLVRRIKMKRCRYDYVEIMACPSGCLNGGGQGTGTLHSAGDQKQILKETEESYHKILKDDAAQSAALLSLVYSSWIGGKPGSDMAKSVFHVTSYFKRESLSHSDW